MQLARLKNVLQSVAHRMTRHVFWGTWLGLLTQAGWVFTLHDRRVLRVEMEASSLWNLVLSFVSLYCLSQALNLLFTRGRLSSFLVNSLLVLWCFLLSNLHFLTRASMEYELIRSNWREIFFLESLRVMLAGPNWIILLAALSVWTTLLVLDRRYLLFPLTHPVRWRWPRLAVSSAVWTAILVSPLQVHDEITFLAQSVLHYYRAPVAPLDHAFLASRGVDEKAPFPLVRPSTSPGDPNGARPHVFMVVMESINAHFIGTRTPEGQEYTPFINSLLPKGVHARHFYGNSVQTAKGQLALLCSTLPLIKGKVFTDKTNLNLRCLPRTLQDHGYKTFYFTAGRDLDFDNLQGFMPRNGFDVVQAIPESEKTEEEKANSWGWGLQDDYFYRNILRRLDAHDGSKPVFAVVANVSNHQPFTEIPEALKQLYPGDTTRVPCYKNSIHFADRSLAVFFAELDKRPQYANRVVVVVGDHSFPTGEHGFFFNEVGGYEETFKTLFWMQWPGMLEPRQLTETYAQVDVAPTITDLLGIGETTHWMGQSMVHDPPAHPRVVHLIQPYDGAYLATVRWPFKYMLHVRTNRTLLYHLEQDPHESHSVLATYKDHPTVRLLEQEMSFIFLGHRLIMDDRIWPAPPARP